jgi:hypothetical protein
LREHALHRLDEAPAHAHAGCARNVDDVAVKEIVATIRSTPGSIATPTSDMSAGECSMNSFAPAVMTIASWSSLAPRNENGALPPSASPNVV